MLPSRNNANGRRLDGSLADYLLQSALTESRHELLMQDRVIWDGKGPIIFDAHQNVLGAATGIGERHDIFGELCLGGRTARVDLAFVIERIALALGAKLIDLTVFKHLLASDPGDAGIGRFVL